MKILFLDQSGKLGGAELSLLDLAKFYRSSCLVCLFSDGLFKEALEENQVPVRILSKRSLQIYKDSNFWQSIKNIKQLIPLIIEVVQLSHDYDIIYANTQKAMVVGSIASWLTGKKLVYHLHDIISLEHFSKANRQLVVLFANRFASLIIANSRATKSAFIEAKGRADLIEVVYNGFNLEQYQERHSSKQLKQNLNLKGNNYIIGSFSRLSPWKGQHILLQALTYCPEVMAILVGDALFGEHEYVKELHQQIEWLGLNDRVIFLGFRTDIPQLMSACDLIVHTSIAPEPFGRVIVEAMLCGKPVVATAAGGVTELISHYHTGWLTIPGNVSDLAATINQCRQQIEMTQQIAIAGKNSAVRRFDLSNIQQQINYLLGQIVSF